MIIFEGTPKKILMGRLNKGDDLLEEMEKLVRFHNVCMGTVSLIGAVTEATIGFYAQDEKKYMSTTFNREMEIVSCQGSISLKDGNPMIHAHISLADSTGQAIGGHLMPGTRVFAAEYIIQTIQGQVPIRNFDDETGLSLWH